MSMLCQVAWPAKAISTTTLDSRDTCALSVKGSVTMSKRDRVWHLQTQPSDERLGPFQTTRCHMVHVHQLHATRATGREVRCNTSRADAGSRARVSRVSSHTGRKDAACCGARPLGRGREEFMAQLQQGTRRRWHNSRKACGAAGKGAWLPARRSQAPPGGSSCSSLSAERHGAPCGAPTTCMRPTLRGCSRIAVGCQPPRAPPMEPAHDHTDADTDRAVTYSAAASHGGACVATAAVSQPATTQPSRLHAPSNKALRRDQEGGKHRHSSSTLLAAHTSAVAALDGRAYFAFGDGFVSGLPSSSSSSSGSG